MDYHAHLGLALALGTLGMAGAAAAFERWRISRAASRGETWPGPMFEGAVALHFWLGLAFAALFVVGAAGGPAYP